MTEWETPKVDRVSGRICRVGFEVSWPVDLPYTETYGFFERLAGKDGTVFVDFSVLFPTAGKAPLITRLDDKQRLTYSRLPFNAANQFLAEYSSTSPEHFFRLPEQRVVEIARELLGHPFYSEELRADLSKYYYVHLYRRHFPEVEREIRVTDFEPVTLPQAIFNSVVGKSSGHKQVVRSFEPNPDTDERAHYLFKKLVEGLKDIDHDNPVVV